MTQKVSKEIQYAALAESLVGSFLDPEDIGSAVAFLCGSGARRITGQILRVDGGQCLGPI
jgi:3-oxoacyl-[acyl-carrier protein] reductase